MNELVDTLLNVVAFVFIGVLIWLYFKPEHPEEEDDEPSNS